MPPGIAGLVIDSPDECLETTGSSTVSVKLDSGKGLIAETVGTKTLAAYRYDADKRLVARAGWVTNANPSPFVFQHDYTYDVAGHVVVRKFSTVAAPPFYEPAVSTSYYLWQHTNTYDVKGALVRSLAEPSGPLATNWWGIDYLFEENALGQCVKVERRYGPTSAPTRVITEVRTYDEAGRLSRVDSSGDQSCAFQFAGVPPMTSSALLTYDAQGRLTQRRFWCDGTKATTDPPGQSTTIEYAADGSQRVERIDNLADYPVDPVVTERSPHCAVIDAWRGGPRSALEPATTRCTALE